MIDEICAEIKNWFVREGDRHIGDFSVVNGAVVPAVESPSGYIRIINSHLNDGVHNMADADLVDEGEFHGAVCVMSPPKTFLALVAEIAEWQDKYGGAGSYAMSPFNSESFGGYSYTKAAGTGAAGVGGSNKWQDAYRKRLDRWRKI